MAEWHLKHALLLCMTADKCVNGNNDPQWAIFTLFTATFHVAPLATIECINKRGIIAKIGCNRVYIVQGKCVDKMVPFGLLRTISANLASCAVEGQSCVCFSLPRAGTCLSHGFSMTFRFSYQKKVMDRHGPSRLLKGGPEPHEKESHEFLGSKRDDRFSNPFF